MEMHDVVAALGKYRAKPERGTQVQGVSNRKRMTYDTRSRGSRVKLSARVAGKLCVVSRAKQFQRESENLGFAAGKAKLGIDPENAKRTFHGVARARVGGTIVLVVVGGPFEHRGPAARSAQSRSL
jgi:hypothetical protein